MAVDVRRCSTRHIIVGEGGGPGKEEEGRKKLLMNRSTSGGVTPGSGGAECWANKVVVRITAIVHGCHMLDTVGGGGGGGGGGGMSDAYQVLMRRFRAAAPAAATPPTGYTHFTSLTQTLSWKMGSQVLVFP